MEKKQNNNFNVLELMILVCVIPLTTIAARVIMIVIALLYLLGEALIAAYNNGKNNK